MAKRKTKTRRNVGKRKKPSLPKKPSRPMVTEWDGLSAGDEVWVRLDPYGTEEWGFGAIIEFFPKDKIEVSFDFFDKVKKRFTTGAISKIAETPPKRWLGKVS
jgi:hypothetical protein